MKNGTLFGGRVKKAYAKLKKGATLPEIPEPDEPLRRLAIAILGVGCNDDIAAKGVDRALKTLVDWNEMRVSNEFELNKATGNTIPNGVERCAQLIAALQSVYDRENRMSLARLHSMGRRDAKQFLEQLEGVDEYAVASVTLWSLGGHAIPVNDHLLGLLRSRELVHESATRAEVQAFLERHVSAAEAKTFCLLMPTLSPKASADGKRTKAKSTTAKKVSKKKKKVKTNKKAG